MLKASKDASVSSELKASKDLKELKPKITRKIVIEYLDSENVMVPLGTYASTIA
jgi:hypothetical protein